MAGEPGGGEPAFRARLEEGWGAKVTEAMGIGDIGVSLWGECEEQDGMHLGARGFVHAELVEPATGEALELEDGATGELVLTHLRHRAAPLLRFRTRDHVQVRTSPCPCGRTGPRVRCVGRTDDMLIVRGVNVFPSAVREVVSGFAPAVSGQILVRPQAPGVKQEPPLPVSVELAQGATGDDALAEAIRDRLRERPGRPDARRARAVGEPAAERVQVEARGARRMSLVTTVVGSYPQPDWLIDRERLGDRLPPRVRARELWRVPEPLLEEAQDDATRLAVQDMERAGVDVITDGEMRRESYSNRFATALEGVDLDRSRRRARPDGPREPGPAGRRPDPPHAAGRGPRRRVPPLADRPPDQDHRARARSRWRSRPRTTTTPTSGASRSAYAEAVNEELRDLKAAGADVVQIDEPYLQARPEPAREYGVEAINRALEGVDGDTVLHTCFGYAHIVHERPTGYPFLRELADCRATHLSLEAAQPDLDPEVLRAVPRQGDRPGRARPRRDEVETPEVVAERIRAALAVVGPERLVVAPDCGMKYLPRERAFRKLEAMVAGARIVSNEL